MDNSTAMARVPRHHLRMTNVREPWAWALVSGKKNVENRPFHIKTPVWVLILASKSKPTKKDMVALEERLNCDQAPTSFASQCIIGAVQFIDSVEQFDSKWYDGGIAWVVGDYIELPTPIENVPGALTPMLYVDRHPLRERIFKELDI